MVQIVGCRVYVVFILQSVYSFSGLRLLKNRRKRTASVLPNCTLITSQNYGRHEQRLNKTGYFKRKIMGFYLVLSSVLCYMLVFILQCQIVTCFNKFNSFLVNLHRP